MMKKGAVAVFFILVSFSLAFPAITEASILSMVSGLFTASVSSAQQETAPITSNSQKMPLLEAPLNSDVARVESTTPTISTDNSALVADFSTQDTVDLGTQPNEIFTYKVKSGDTLSGIANKYGISTNTILWANNLSKTAKLKLGQELIILPVTGVQYKVKSGDTVQSVAKKFKGDANEVISFNDLGEDGLKVGDIIVIPDGILSIPVVAPITGGVSTKPYVAAISIGNYIRPVKVGTKTQGIHGWNAVDLAASCGTPLYASAAGTVIISKNSGWNGGYGNYVVINHPNGSQTVYGHMQHTTVSVGEQVAQDEQIGYLGNSGNVSGPTGCHVHFEIRNGPRNPF